jgi:hypothetical protein
MKMAEVSLKLVKKVCGDGGGGGRAIEGFNLIKVQYIYMCVKYHDETSLYN